MVCATLSAFGNNSISLSPSGFDASVSHSIAKRHTAVRDPDGSLSKRYFSFFILMRWEFNKKGHLEKDAPFLLQ